jgi:hypothetical protein
MSLFRSTFDMNGSGLVSVVWSLWFGLCGLVCGLVSVGTSTSLVTVKVLAFYEFCNELLCNELLRTFV